MNTFGEAGRGQLPRIDGRERSSPGPEHSAEAWMQPNRGAPGCGLAAPDVHPHLVHRGGRQHSTKLTGTLTARPPVEVSLYLECMSAPVVRMVSMTWSSVTCSTTWPR